MRDLSLNRHRHPIARVFSFYRNLIWHFGSARAFFLRILEYPEALKSSAPDEIQQTGEFLFGFPGESDDESGTQRHPWNSGAQLVDQIFDVLPRRLAADALQHRLMDMLRWNSYVAGDRVAVCDGGVNCRNPVGGLR